MPFIDTKEVRLHYLAEGREDAPWLVLSNPLGTTLDVWSPQMPALLRHFRVLRYDTRGHGQSSVPPGPYSIGQLGGDVVALLDALGIARAHFCGLSMGSITGIWMGIHQPSRVDHLVLSNTSAYIGPPESWDARIAKINSEGVDAIVPAVIDRWFSADFQRRSPQQIEQVRRMLHKADPAGYVASCAAVRDMDLRGAVGRIAAPTLVIAGRYDQGTTPGDGKFVADRIAGARFIELEASHLSNWEAADAFTAEVTGFLLQGEANG